MLVFLFGMGMLNPIGTALTLTPFGARAGAASALLGFLQMTAAALAIITATTMAASPFLALSIVLATMTTVAALVFCLRA
jgi:DHA1 family bicyclomycin/chloramphenicol resistance-like MFS transporter